MTKRHPPILNNTAASATFNYIVFPDISTNHHAHTPLLTKLIMQLQTMILLSRSVNGMAICSDCFDIGLVNTGV